MISALPQLLAARAAHAVNAVATPTGLFAAPCRAETGTPTGTLPQTAAVYAALGALTHDSDVGGRSAGEALATPFTASVVLHLIGPDSMQLNTALRTPSDAPTDGRDLMLSVVLDRLLASDETGGLAVDTADILAGGRRLSARWRFDQLTAITPQPFGTRQAWRLEVLFRGSQTLSAVPAEGGHILQIAIDSQSAPDPKHMTARIDATTDDLPISVIANIGPENANQFSAFSIVKLVDLLRIPKTQLDATAVEIAGSNTSLEGTLKLLHLFLDLRRSLVFNGINAGFLNTEFAELTLDQVWDGTTLTLPAQMPADQKLRVELLAKPLMPFLRTDAWPRLTLGQLSTAKAEV